MRTIVLRKAGNLVDISPDGINALSNEIRSLLEPLLTYTYIQRLYGQGQYNSETGKYDRKLQFIPRQLFRYDTRGRMVCGAGSVGKLVNVLEAQGYVIKYVDKDPPRIRPNCFDVNWDLVEETFTFRAKQKECLQAIASNPFGIIDAPTGFGKGIIIAMVCLLFPKAKIHIVTPGKDLVSKTVRKLSEYLPNIGQVGIGRKYESRVTVYSADSLHLSDGDADILIADEAHELLAPSYSKQLAKYRFSRNYAFTATPEGRMDNADMKMEVLFGQPIFSMSYQEAVDLGLVVPIRVEWIDLFMDWNPVENKSTLLSVKRWGFWRNHERNAALAKKLEQYIDDQILVLVDTIEHAIHLKQYLPTFELCYDKLSGEDRRFYIKQGLLDEDEPIMTAQRREQMRLDFESGKLKHVIATGVWATGVSFDALPVLCWAAAGASKIKSTQIPGRVCRIHHQSGKDVGILIDCCDQFDKKCATYSDTRSRYYARHGWEQVYEDGRKKRKKRIQLE